MNKLKYKKINYKNGTLSVPEDWIVSDYGDPMQCDNVRVIAVRNGNCPIIVFFTKSIIVDTDEAHAVASHTLPAETYQRIYDNEVLTLSPRGRNRDNYGCVHTLEEWGAATEILAYPLDWCQPEGKLAYGCKIEFN